MGEELKGVWVSRPVRFYLVADEVGALLKRVEDAPRPYAGLYLGGVPACAYCGEDLCRPRAEPQWCPACGAGVEKNERRKGEQ